MRFQPELPYPPQYHRGIPRIFENIQKARFRVCTESILSARHNQGGLSELREDEVTGKAASAVVVHPGRIFYEKEDGLLLDDVAEGCPLFSEEIVRVMLQIRGSCIRQPVFRIPHPWRG